MKNLPLIIAFGCGVLAIILVLSASPSGGITGSLVADAPLAAGSSLSGLLVLFTACIFSTAMICYVHGRKV